MFLYNHALERERTVFCIRFNKCSCCLEVYQVVDLEPNPMPILRESLPSERQFRIDEYEITELQVN